MNVARSFDINKPGTAPKNIKGGVLGGTISSGQVKIGDKLETQLLVPEAPEDERFRKQLSDSESVE